MQQGSPHVTHASGLRFIRRNDRREVRKAVALGCQVIRERDFRIIATQALDLSPDGMLVRTTSFVEPGENMLVCFKATSLGLWFDSEASVARVIQGRRTEDKGGVALGLSFSTLDRVKRLILRGHLRRIPPPLPRRAQRIDWTATVRSLST
ncbi:MAG: PilZ domain-containing protein [Labilithrix sp.]|nr:PilZ domain-containing protein [Labilithrix sp.]